MATVITYDEIYELKDCISCKNVELDDTGRFLHCKIHDKRVNDNDLCEDYKE